MRHERCLFTKRWGKCHRRCIVKFYFLAFIEWISTFYYVYLWVYVSEILHWKKNAVNCVIIYPFRVISKLGWYWNKLKTAKEMNACNNECIWCITWNLSRYYERKNFHVWTKSWPQTGTDRQADGQIDRRTERWTGGNQYTPPPQTSFAGGIIKLLTKVSIYVIPDKDQLVHKRPKRKRSTCTQETKAYKNRGVKSVFVYQLVPGFSDRQTEKLSQTDFFMSLQMK